MEKSEKEIIQDLQKTGWTIENIAKAIKKSVETVKSWRYRDKSTTRETRNLLLNLPPTPPPKKKKAVG